MIKLSKAAASEIRRVQSKRQKPEAKLRLGVSQGGCADFYYTIDFEQVINSEDQVYDCDGISVIVDPESLKTINGLTLDYSEDLMGGGFRFHNPNASESCGCGNSFRVDPSKAPD
ncbi:iron-sulfur cluster assembly accessory protein [Moorena sp. SIO3H5]|uniref:HesB/IscA family protein n=1 Tax=Moorena sp. SIO3H5 TaxID=2607834 RepID=UPI0013B6498B|nr:iron-sulfur cluster assembly accessory protein [Moorena sp. SIO3H5]NEO72546.1 iron-sulfur cluster assembly accessory protein [Moorena sp. SIO3H5]